ncbi:hypothetical protein KP509_26G059300 [Ceratopteris richardii]|uniref:Uncharacterized protein n=1 Tax=Ceratopteris richardii TaxID=49495 RepID=A0A8T2RNR8_CERRI|nr:hypothetical protein KP509_26G059300 [Ceratopteris richardii]
MHIVLERLLRVRLGLMRTVVSREWSDLHDIGTPKFISFSRMVMDDAWWTEADIFIKSIRPIYSVLRLTDMEGSTIGLLYGFMDRIDESFQKNTVLSSDRLEKLRSIWNRRLDWFYRPIHALAHVLHPLWRSEEQESNKELLSNTSDFFSRWASDDLSMIRKLEDELLLVHEHLLSFGGPTPRLRETQLEPVSWWHKYGTSAPTLVWTKDLLIFIYDFTNLQIIKSILFV